MSSSGNRPGAIVLAVIAAGMLIVGLNALTHIDYCGDSVMDRTTLCPNTSNRPHKSWLNDYDHQKARNERVGKGMTAGSAVMFLGAGLVWAYGTLNVFRIVFRRPARRRAKRDPSRPTEPFPKSSG